MRLISRVSLGLALVAATTVVASTASAQASVSASATVASALQVFTRDLDFGTVFPGVNKTVDFADAAAGRTSGRFNFAAEAGSTISLTWGAVPANLVGPGGATLAFAAPGLEGCSTTSAAAAGCSANYAFASGNITMPAGAAGTQTNHYIFVRGTVAPTAAQAAGAYSATITVTAAYTGS
jgi:spore coat protein U-like protein